MHDMLIRAWKDQEFRSTLNDETLATLPPHPAGSIDDVAADLNDAAGGMNSEYLMTLGCCHGVTAFCATLTKPLLACTAGCISVWYSADPCICYQE